MIGPRPYKAPNFKEGQTLLPPKPITSQTFKKPQVPLQQGDGSNLTSEPVAPFGLSPIVQGSKPILPPKQLVETPNITQQVQAQMPKPAVMSEPAVSLPQQEQVATPAPQKLPETGAVGYKPMLDKQEYIRIGTEDEKKSFRRVLDLGADPDKALEAYMMLVDKRVQGMMNENKIDINPFKPIAEGLGQAKEFISKQDNLLVNNPITRGALGALGTVATGLTDFAEGTQNIASKGVSGATGLPNPQEAPTTVGEDIFSTVSGLGSTATAVAPVASAAFNVGMESLPQSVQQKIGGSLGDVGSFIAKTPGLKQWRESLPEEKRMQFDQELAGTAIALLTGTKNKKQALKDPVGFLKTNLNPIEVARNIDEAVLNGLGGTAKMVGNIPKIPGKIGGVIEGGVEKVATKLTKTSTPQDKLFKAQEPRLNQLNKQVDYKKMRKNSDIANQEIVNAGYKPTDTTTRAEAHKATMDKIWKEEIESKIGGMGNIDLTPVADKIDEFVAKAERAGIVTNEGQLNQLKAQSKRYRDMGSVNGSDGEYAKQMLNAQINNFGDASIGDVYKNGLKEATKVLGKQLDDAFSAIPGEFADAKRRFGALKATYEDVFKSDLKSQRAKGEPLIQSYSRLEGAGDIVGGLAGMVTGKNPLPQLAQGGAKLLMGKVLGKIKDKDFLIQKGFEDISKQQKIPNKAPQAPALEYKPNVVQPRTPITPEGVVKEKAVIPPKQQPKTKPIIAERGTAVSPSEKARYADIQAKNAEIQAKKQQQIKIQQEAQAIQEKATLKQKQLESDTKLQKLTPFEPLGSQRIKDGEYVTKYGVIQDTVRGAGGTKLDYVIDGKKYPASEVDVFKKKEVIPVKVEDPTIKDAKLALRNMQDSGQKRNYYLNQLLDEVGAKSIDDLPESKLPELVKVLRSSIRDAKQIDRYENFVKSVRQDLTNKPKIPVKNAMDEYDIKFQTKDSVNNDLYNEARKYKSADEFVKKAEVPKNIKVRIKSKFSDHGAYKEVPVIRKIENKVLYQGGSDGKKQFWTTNKNYASQFGDITSKKGNFYQVDNGNRVIDVYVDAESQLRKIREESNQQIPTKFQTKDSVKNDLYTEARKYKSADEFINTRGKPFFHGTDKKFSKFKTPIEGDYGSEANFFSPTEQGADYYRRTDKGEIKKVFIDNDIKIRERDKEANQKDLIKYVEGFSDDDLKWGKELTIKGIKKGTHYIVQDPIIMKYMKNKGFGGFTNIDHTPNGLEETMGVFSPDKVKTESQLRKIREEAKKQPKIPLKK